MRNRVTESVYFRLDETYFSLSPPPGPNVVDPTDNWTHESIGVPMVVMYRSRGVWCETFGDKIIGLGSFTHFCLWFKFNASNIVNSSSLKFTEINPEIKRPKHV